MVTEKSTKNSAHEEKAVVGVAAARILLRLQDHDRAALEHGSGQPRPGGDVVRDALSARVPEPWSHTYARLLERTKPPWVFPVDGDVCPRCWVLLPTALRDNLGRERIAACVQCGRLLVLLDNTPVREPI